MHKDNGRCEGCQKIIMRYPGFHTDLWLWFNNFQKTYPEAHISCAGRGEQDQNSMFLRGASKARWGESGHNYNASLDLFETKTPGNIYDRTWFSTILQPNLEPWIKWYGSPGSPFFELAHIELTDWRILLSNGKLDLVEK